MRRHLTRTGLLIVGDEILLGRRSDKHFPRALDFFSARAVDLAWVFYVGDDHDLLVHQFKAIRDRGDVCFCFGGIGATPDDRTRQAMADAHDRPLSRHPEAVRLIERQFGREAYPNRILMAELPQGASLIPNEYNNIPGFFLGDIYCLPGFPQMAWPMVEWVIATRFFTDPSARHGFAAVAVPDVRESELIDLLAEVQRFFPQVRVSSLPRFPAEGRWLVELGVRGPDEQVSAAMDWLCRQLQQRGLSFNHLSGS
jgi:molybdopterin-biosynthesis enzyme MoeA-like protein